MATQQQSSSSEAALKKLKEQITCPMCLNCSNNPKLLSCSHSFCLQCLQHILPVLLDPEGNTSIDCPTCRSPSPVPDKGLASLPPSFVINNLMEAYDLMKKVSDHQHVSCDNCDNTNADRYCKQCLSFLCPDCLSLHNKWKKNADHQLLSLEEVASTAFQLLRAKPDPMSCADHNKPLVMYCDTCQQLICLHCTVKKHKNHDYDIVSDTYQQHEDTIVQSSLQSLNKEHDRLKEAKKILVDKQEAISQQVKGIKEEIHHTIAEMKNRLDETEKKLMKDVDLASTTKFHVLDHQLKEIDSVIGQVIECSNYVEQCIKVSSPKKVLLAKSQMMSRTQSVITSVKGKTFEPLEQPDIQLVKGDTIHQIYHNVGKIKYTLNFSSAKVSYGHIPLVKQQSTVTISLTAFDGSLVPVPSSSLIKCRLTPPIQCSVKESSQSGQYDVVFTPLYRCLHQLHITVDDRTIPGSPVSVPVTVPPQMRGTFVQVITATEPSGIAVTDDGLVVVSEAACNHITILDKEGEKIRSFGLHSEKKRQLNNPQGVAVTLKQTILVADCSNNRIQEFTMEGNCISCVGSKGIGPLQFNFPHGIAINKTTGQVFVSDTYNHRIQVLHQDLTFAHMFGSEGFGQGMFNYPHDVTIDNQGFVFVTDTSNHRVQKFTVEGKFISSFGTRGYDPGQLHCPTGITVDDNDLLYVKNSHNKYITVLTTNGQHIHSFDMGNDLIVDYCLFFHGIAFKNDGTLLVCYPRHNEIFKS